MKRTLEVFLLGRESRPGPKGTRLTYWAQSSEGAVSFSPPPQPEVFFVPRSVITEAGTRRPVELRTMVGPPGFEAPEDGAEPEAVDAVYFSDRKALRREAERLRMAGTPPWEEEVRAADRYLMERFIRGFCVLEGEAELRRGVLHFERPVVRAVEGAARPKLRLASFDVEAHSLQGPTYSVAIVDAEEEHVFLLGEPPAMEGKAKVHGFGDERSLLAAFIDHVQRLDPDVLIGWNVIDFDLVYLEDRCRALKLPFNLGRRGARATVLRGDHRNNAIARIPGRAVLDGITTMRAGAWYFERWGLQHVAQQLLGRGKAIEKTLDPVAEIRRLYREELGALVEYNLEDCRLVWDIFEHAQVLEFAIERQLLTGLGLERRAGSVAAFDFLYLPQLHRRGVVAPSLGFNPNPITSPGGYVLASRPGLFENVLVLDFKSLYPSIIRTFRIDPFGLDQGLQGKAEKSVEGFLEAKFGADDAILPTVIEDLWAARDKAKKVGDKALSQAIKILMNSFYGVLGTPSCRFYDPRLASSITLRGHEILQRSRGWIQRQGWEVIYGDTDSLFVLIGKDPEKEPGQIGAELATELNAWWQEKVREEHGIESALEVEYETHYRHFLMPTMRGSSEGSKKRYGGLVDGPDGGRLVMKGLEAVRSDWTPLARRFQRELFRRVFHGEEYGRWISDLAASLRRGELDGELVYHRRLRRRTDEYAAKGAPPHVVAARLLEKSAGVRIRDIEYVMTVDGARPVRTNDRPLDYDHYLRRQLEPAADTMLVFLGDRFEDHAGRQLRLF